MWLLLTKHKYGESMGNKIKDDNKTAKAEKEDSKKKKDDKTKDEKKVEFKKPIIKSIEGVRGIVRLGNADLIGSRRVKGALLNVKGISHNFAAAILAISGVDRNRMIGTLTDEELHKLEDIAKNPIKYKIPRFLINRRADPVTGEDVHLISSDLTFVKKADIDSLKKMQCYKGVRHQFGLPCRGQHTRSSFRTGVRMGVIKKKEAPKKAAENKK